jgi:hypothetical protein
MIAFTGSTATLQAKAGINRRLESVEYPHQLFPYHWNIIIADVPEPQTKPDWVELKYNGRPTEVEATDLDKRYASTEELVGVRFGSETKYVLIDIDRYSLCHPAINENEWNRFLKALGEAGLVSEIVVRSSDNGGIHIYFWFGEELETYKVAQLLWSICHAGKFDLRGGNVETFPNTKKFRIGAPSSYQAHRLPVQPNSGSILLDGQDLTERWDLADPWKEFCRRVAGSRQNMELLKRKLTWGKRYWKKHARRSGAVMTTTAVLWRQDLDDRLQLGWTANGQTNRLIRSACVRYWVFTSNGDRDDAAIVEQLVNMPNYQEFCRHQHEIAVRVRDWMDTVVSMYWPYSRQDLRHGRPIRKPDGTMAPNQSEPKAKSTKRQDDVISRIRQIVAALVDQSLPREVVKILELMKEKAKELKIQVFSNGTLYNPKYQPEWRILVDIARSQAEQSVPRIQSGENDTKKTPSNPEPVKLSPNLFTMKVGALVKIRIINFLSSFFTKLKSRTDESANRSENLGSQTASSIETNEFISFTNGNMTPGAAPAAISKSYKSLPALDFLAVIDSESVDGSVEFERLSDVERASSVLLQDTCKNLQDSSRLEVFDPPPMEPIFLEAIEDDNWPVIGGFLRRIRACHGGKNIPELIARVVRLSGTSWHLECDEGHHWRCPIDMVGETWVIYHPSQ